MRMKTGESHYTLNWIYKMEESQRISIDDMAISVRTTNLIVRHLKIKYIDELCAMTPGEILMHRNIGLRSLNEIRSFLKENQMCLKGDVFVDSKKQREIRNYAPQI